MPRVNCGCSGRNCRCRFKGFKGFKEFKKFIRFTGSASFRAGIRVAATACMATAKDFTELVAWQRADDLERFVQGIIKRPLLARDFEFCRQASDAASSAPRNIAEGFGRFAPVQFANFLRIAIGSELETKNQILKAWQRGAITDEEHYVGVVLCKRAIGATVGLRRYLVSQQARANARSIESGDEP